MNGVIFAIVVVLVLIGKIREAMKGSSGGGSDVTARGGGSLSDRVSASSSDDSFSLQNVLAEIQKVKDQAERTTGMSGAQLRDRIERRTISEQKRKELAERAGKRRESLRIESAPTREPTGPMGRSGGVPLASDPSPEDNLSAEAPGGSTSAPVVMPTGAVPAALTPARLTSAQLRDGAIWREILSPPVSMRDE